ncbi:MAG: sulfatase [bacterium]
MRWRFFSRFDLQIALLCFFLLSCGQGVQPAKRVLLITLDTVRADALGCYGFGTAEALTTNLDRLAAQGTIFRRATCQIPSTLPSHTAILTGRLPRSTGVRFGSDRVPDEITTLAEICREAGFSTAAFLSSAVLNTVFGLDQGFDVYNDIQISAGDMSAERSAEETTDLALQWLQDRGSDEPFLLWVHYYDAHSPYEPSSEDVLLGSENYRGPIDGSADQITRLVANRGEGLTQLDLQRLRSLYLTEVSCVDWQVGRLLEAFDTVETGLPSIVVAVSDHGENLGEGGRFFHGADLFETCMHIPLIIRWPGGRYGSTEVSDVVMAMDVMPTILKACALPVPESIDGCDLGVYPEASSQESRASLSPRVGLLETEHAYLGDADKILGAVSLNHKLIDRRHRRRDPVLVGRALRIPIMGACYLRAFVRGDVTANVVAHIRFHTVVTAGSTDPKVVEEQPTILVSASRLGSEAIHSEHDFPQVPDGWTALGTTDLYQRSMDYGRAQGWPLEHVVIESIAVDVAGVPGQRTVEAWVDDVVLVGKTNVAIDNFEAAHATVYRDAGVGVKHMAGSRVEPGKGIDGSAGLHVVAKYPPGEDVWKGTQFYRFDTPAFPTEGEDLLLNRGAEIPKEANELAARIDEWLKKPPAPKVPPAMIDRKTDEALRSLGYL